MDLKKIKSSIELQHDQSDCGVACLKSLVRYYGGDISLEKLRELSGTSKQGTTLLGLYQCANLIGFNATGCEADIQAIIEHAKPVILHVILKGNLQHYVVCYGLEKDKFIIADPAKGLVFYTKDELLKIWLSKSCLCLEPNNTFQETGNIKKEKKKWFLNLLKEDYEILLTSIAIGIAIAILGMVMAVYSQKLIDNILPSKNLEKLVLSIIAVALLLAARTGFMAVRQYLLITQSKHFNNRIIHYFYNTLLYLPKSFFDTRKTGELAARLNDTSRVQRVITQMAGNYIIDTLVALTSLGFLLIYSWQTALIALISMPVYFILIYSFNKKIIESQKAVMSAYALSESNYISTMSGISEIKIFNKQQGFANLNKSIYGSFQEHVFKLGKINVKLSFVAGITGVIFLASILIYNSCRVLSGNMLTGELMAVLGIASTLLPSISNLALISIPLNEAKVAFNRMYEFTGIAPEDNNPGTNTEFKLDNIEVQNISFRFQGRKRILENIRFSIQKGELVSVIGESGSGKTTLGYILQKFYKPETGTIMLNGSVNLESMNHNTWRAIIGVVPQDIHIFNGNVIDNICIGEVQADVEKLLCFMDENGFSSFIKRLPQAYATLLGEEGINISGGQKQIIALARALYKNPQVLILDEATAAMDRETELFTTTLLNKIKHKTAILYISHRLHVLKNISDKICILEKGRITDSGTHLELMSKKNMYSDYWSDFAIKV